MIKHRFSLGLVALFATLLAQAAPMPALAQGISQKVAVCNPDFTGRCVKPDASGNTPVTGTVTVVPSGTQDSNIKQVNGATVNVGVGAAGTGTQRVTTSTDSTIGTVTAVTAITNALPAGSNIVGKVGIDQTTPGTTNGVQINAALPAGAALIGKVGIDQTTPGTTNFVYGNISQLGGVATPTGGGSMTAASAFIPCGGVNSSSGNGALICRVSPATGGLMIDGPTASGTAAIGNPVMVGCKLNTTSSQFADGNRAECQVSENGGLVVSHWATGSNRWNFAAGASGIVNTTTAVTIKAAAAAGLRNYLNSCQVSHDTLGAVTELVFRDGAAGTVLERMKLQTAAQEGITWNFDAPIRGTAATLMEVATLTAVTGGVYVNCQGFVAP